MNAYNYTLADEPGKSQHKVTDSSKNSKDEKKPETVPQILDSNLLNIQVNDMDPSLNLSGAKENAASAF